MTETRSGIGLVAGVLTVIAGCLAIIDLALAIAVFS